VTGLVEQAKVEEFSANLIRAGLSQSILLTVPHLETEDTSHHKELVHGATAAIVKYGIREVTREAALVAAKEAAVAAVADDELEDFVTMVMTDYVQHATLHAGALLEMHDQELESIVKGTFKFMVTEELLNADKLAQIETTLTHLMVDACKDAAGELQSEHTMQEQMGEAVFHFFLQNALHHNYPGAQLP